MINIQPNLLKMSLKFLSKLAFVSIEHFDRSKESNEHIVAILSLFACAGLFRANQHT